MEEPIASKPGGEGLERLEFPRIRRLLEGLAASFEGKRRAAGMLPFAERDEAERCLRLVAALRARAEAGAGLPPPEVGDLRPVFSRLRMEGAVLGAEALLSLTPLLRSVREAKAVLGAAADEHPELASLGEDLAAWPHLERALEATFEPGGEIRDGASPALRRIRREREALRERLRGRMERRAAELTVKDAASLVTLREGRFVLAVPQASKAKVKGLVQDRSATGATFYMEPMEAVEENNALRELDSEEREELRRILAELTERFRGEEPALREAWRRVGVLDELRAKALLAVRWQGEVPEFTAGPELSIAGARHPLLLESRGVERDREAARAAVRPLELALDRETRLVLITGPNMGGKTVALKCVGLASVLAQCGCPVPADPGARLPWVDHWVVSLGDEQSLENDLSTFGAHLARWGEALRLASPRTLVLLDELGSGTDPTEGAALARSVLERLSESGALGMVTTHLGVLKAYAAEAEGIRNASMMFDTGSREPTFRLAVGVPGESHAIDMARKLGFPEERVARAEALLPRTERDVKKLLAELEAERKKLAESRRDAEARRREAERLEKERKDRLERFLEERATLRARSAKRARELLRRAEERVRRIEVEARSRDDAGRGLRRELQREEARLARLETRRRPGAPGRAPDRVAAGERYWAESLGREVEVLREPDSSGRVLVRQGGLRVEIPMAGLRGVSPAKDVAGGEPVRATGTVLPEAENASPEVHLLGLRVDEALKVLEHAMDQALLAGLREIRVVHGKGTGALRSAVRRFAEGHSAVASTRTANQWEGGMGATILVLED